MCGIFSGQTSHFNYHDFYLALQKINHRGPDSNQLISFDNNFFGHTRLSINDIEGGQQPIFNEDKSIVAIVNGEFYNFEEIRDKLIKEGHNFSTQSDSEILIHLYEKYSIECLNYLHGEFAFSLYDKNKKRWFCARDRMGIRPLLYYYSNNNLIFSSELKSILALPFIDKKLDLDSVWFSQHLQYLPKDKTLIKGINMIEPGSYLIFENNNLKIQSYWNLKNIKQQVFDFDEAKEKSKELIFEAMKKRIPKEVKWTSHLSGGIDSSIVTAIGAKEHYLTDAFTVQFTDQPLYDESMFAKETANFLGINLHVIPVSFNDILDNLPNAVYHGEGLSINGHLSAKYILNKEIKKNGFKVAFSGEGSDEIFMGYSHLKKDYLSFNSLTNFEQQYLTGFQISDGNTLDLDLIKNSLGFIPSWLEAKSSMAFKFQSLWTSNFKGNINPYEAILKDLVGYSSPLKSSSGSWAEYCLSGYILKVLDDAQSAAHGLEGRLPFLDTDLVEFAFSLPDSVYFHNNIEKGLLREGFKNYLPELIINKTKQSFMSPPMNNYLNTTKFQNLLNEFIFDNKKLSSLEIFDKNKVFDLTKNIQDKNNFEPIIMTILCLGIFTKKFI